MTISPETTVSDASGNYVFTDIAPGYHTIIVEKDGYITATVSWDLLPGESYIFNVGLYEEPPAINPRPGFVKGIITWDAGGWLIDYYYKRGLFQPTYTIISDHAGGTLTTVSDPVFVKEVDETHVVMGTTHNNGNYWRMMNDTEYSILVNDAHSKGLEFMLWLGIIDGGVPVYWDIVYSSSTPSNSFWNDWFSEYEKYAVESASMAERLGIEYICLGHDMGYANGASKFSGGAPDCLARWEKLITAIRDVYPGKLVYFGGADPLRDYYEDNDYPPGFTALFDAIGLNIQSIHANFNPSLQELKTAVSDFLDRYISWQCPLFIMLRTPSVDGGTSFDTYIEPLLVVNHEADKHTRNVWQQADIYEAFFEVINERPVGNGEVMGLFSWGYNYLNDYLITPDHEPDGAMAMDKSGNIRGKPAEAIMKFWDFGE